MGNNSPGRWRHGIRNESSVTSRENSAPTRCEVGERVEITGWLRTVTLQPCDSLCALTAELYDGSDAIDLVWLGRRSITGIDAGRNLRVSGRIALRDGHKTIYNPIYSLLPPGVA